MSRKILHFDLDAFFCAVEEQRDPTLRGKPFAVGGKPDERGVVASCSYPARRFGIHSAMPMAQAVRRCPNLLIVPANHKAYGAVSRKVMARLHTLTPLVEQLSIDEAFLDVTALAEPAAQIARQLQAEIRDALGLPCSLGVASNKLVAKIANNVGKAEGKLANNGAAPPNAIMVVPPGQEAAFLDPLPCDELWGVGPKTADRLRALSINTIGDIARWPAVDLAFRFGKHGEALAQHARGLDQRAVETEHEAKSISQETTFTQDVRDEAQLRQTLQELSQGVSRALKRQKLAGVTVKLKIRWPDFTTPTRQITLAHPVDDLAPIYETALILFERIWPPNQPVRLLGVGVSGFEQQARQLTLWDVAEEMESEARKSEKEQRLEAALQNLRARFGDKAVLRASDVAQ
ncbi:MAG: DNA polymerase IV [Caldilineaceae bacterium]|nr:DNA polymerase IV [Caldilineaceae bacterium]